jgi:hypothetical protein
MVVDTTCLKVGEGTCKWNFYVNGKAGGNAHLHKTFGEILDEGIRFWGTNQIGAGSAV